MALTVLIVEDEQSASRLLSGIAAEVGLSARATRSAKEAQELCAQGAPGGGKRPIIGGGGVYKTLPDEVAAGGRPAAFFAKPFEPAALRAALAKHAGVQSSSPPLEGPLSQRPAAAVLVQLLREKATG